MDKTPIAVGSRKSPLAQAQVLEVLQELLQHHPHIRFDTLYTDTYGDRDRKTSLRSLDKTDFFTKEVDELLLNKTCRIAIHSAKDLPDPLPKGLTIIAITKGVDSSDVLVLRPNETLNTLPKNSVIATSSTRREEMVKLLRNDLSFIDLRGTIQERLHKLETKEADGIVVAEAALIRLNLTHLNRIYLPGKTTPFQGQLAIMARKDDIEMATLFHPLDSRR